MGFYHPSTIVSDAQRHGLKVLSVDVTKSDWSCTLEPQSAWSAEHSASETHLNKLKPVTPSEAGDLGFSNHYPTHSLRLGLRYVRGLREEAGQAIIRERLKATFASIHDLIHRVPELRKDELDTLGEIGALNSIGKNSVSSCLHSGFSLHRRDALWQVERAVRYSGPLLEELPEPDSSSPLQPMNHEERLIADFHGTGLTVGPHPMAYRRAEMNRLGVHTARDLAQLPNGRHLRIAGCIIVRQRPGTAKGFVFLSMEDETGIANVIINPDMFQKNRLLLVSEKFVLVEGILQNQDNVISVKAERIVPLHITEAETTSHDFH
jgi:error-prone DNA polymerase